jgi:hypothetical protein
MEAWDLLVIALLAVASAGIAVILWNVPDYSPQRRWTLLTMFVVLALAVCVLTLTGRPR